MTSEDPRIARTKARVLEAAYALLTESGFGQVTIEHISERSGVARSTLYRHWRSRDEILRDAFSSVALEPAPEYQNLRQALRRYSCAFAHGLERLWGRAAVSLAVSALDDPSQWQACATFQNGVVRDVAALLKRAAERGELVGAVDSVDPADVADLLLAPLFYRYLFTQRPLDEAFATAQADRVHAHLTGSPDVVTVTCRTGQF